MAQRRATALFHKVHEVASRRLWQPFLTLSTLAYATIALTPVCLLGAYSIFTQNGYSFHPALDFANFVTGITEPGNLSVLSKTLEIMFLAAAISTVVAYAVAYCVAVVAPRLLRPMMVVAMFALFGGYLVRVFAWRILLGPDGIFATLFGRPGPLAGIGDLANSRWAVLLALVNFSIPLCLLPIISTFSSLDHHLLSASRDLGAGSLVTFRRVVFPLTQRGMCFGFAIAFILCAGDYVTPALLGGTDGFMFGSLIAQQFNLTYDWPNGGVLALILMASVALVISVVFALIGLTARILSGASRSPWSPDVDASAA